MIRILVINRCAAPPYPAAPDFLHGKACHTILRSLCSLTNRVPLPPHPGDRINRSMLSCRDMASWLSIHSAPACGGKVVAPATKGGNCGMVHEIYDSLFFLSILLVSPLGEMPRRGKRVYGAEYRFAPHRGPDRQSAACVIFASYPWTHPAAADTKKTAPFPRRRFAAVIWLFLQELLLFLLYRKISS